MKELVEVFKLSYVRTYVSSQASILCAETAPDSTQLDSFRIKGLKLAWRGMMFANKIKKYVQSTTATLRGLVDRVEERHLISTPLGDLFVKYFKC